MSIDMRDEAAWKRCVPTQRQTGARSMVVGTWRMDFLMAMGMQWTGIRAMVVGAWRSGDNLGTEARHSYQWKMTKTQRTRIRPMTEGAQ